MHFRIEILLFIWISTWELIFGIYFKVEYVDHFDKTGTPKQREFLDVDYIDGGSYGDVYSGTDAITEGKVAIKMVTKKEELEHEKKIYGKLNAFVSFENAPALANETEARKAGIPYVYIYGRIIFSDYDAWIDRYVLIMELLGRSLNVDIVKGTPISPKVALNRFISMFRSIAYFHKCRVLHGDVKPRNFVHGLGAEDGKIFVIDVGMSRDIDVPSDDVFAPNMYYSSLNCLKIYKNKCTSVTDILSRKREDDLDSLPMVFSMMTFWNLPWIDEMKKFQDFVESVDGYAALQSAWSEGKVKFFDNVIGLVDKFPDVIMQAFTSVNFGSVGQLFTDMIQLGRYGPPIDKSLETSENELLDRWNKMYEEKIEKISPQPDWRASISHFFRPPITPPTEARMQRMEASLHVFGVPGFLKK